MELYLDSAKDYIYLVKFQEEDYMENEKLIKLHFKDLKEKFLKRFENSLQNDFIFDIMKFVEQLYSQVIGKDIKFDYCYSRKSVNRYDYAIYCDFPTKTISFYKEGTIIFGIKYSSYVAGRSNSPYSTKKNIYKIKDINIYLYYENVSNFEELIKLVEHENEKYKNKRRKTVDDMLSYLKEKGIDYEKLKEIYSFYNSLDYYEKNHAELVLN